MKKIELRDRRLVRATLARLFKSEGRKLAELQYIFCTDEYLLDINRRFLKHDFYTDIITFPLSEAGQPIVAEIYISVDRVRENAVEYGHPVRVELLRVVFHGALHLCGHGDKNSTQKAAMRQLEELWLENHNVSRETRHSK